LYATPPVFPKKDSDALLFRKIGVSHIVNRRLRIWLTNRELRMQGAAVASSKRNSALYRVQVLDRALAILDALAKVRGEASLSEIAEAVHMHKSTVHRLMMSLERHRIIAREPASGGYRLGLHLFELGSAAVAQFNVRDRARHYLEAMVNETDETVHLCVLDDGEALYLDKVEPSRSIRMSSRIGLRNPAHCTAVGKVMMAWLSEQEVEAIVHRHGLRRFTAKTITTLAGLRAELKKVRERGYAVDNEENEDGVRCVGAAVRDHSGFPAAAVSISAPSFRMPMDKIQVFAQVVCSAAKDLSREWGYEPPKRDYARAVAT
jgi:DNA-binding IclR family transcriptional regulator